MGRIIRVAAVQMDCTLGDVAANLKQAQSIVERWGPERDLILFPELFLTGYSLQTIGPRLDELAEPIPGPSLLGLAAVARRFGVAVAGTVLERASAPGGGVQVYNTGVVLDRRGDVVLRHRKTHVYPAERPYFAPGTTLQTSDLSLAGGQAVRVGMAICFEHAFPEIFTHYALEGAEVVLIPSVVPQGFEHLMDIRTPARALDGQYFVVAANRAGEEDGVRYCGRSQVVGPDGKLLAHAGEAPGVLLAEIDLDRVGDQRQREPSLSSRRPELYGRIAATSGGPTPFRRPGEATLAPHPGRPAASRETR